SSRLSHAGFQNTVPAAIEELRLVLIQLAAGEDVSAALELVGGWEEVEAAEQNRVMAPTQAVNDPHYRFQWALDRIHAEPAWQHILATIAPGAQGVVVAVTDTGIRIGHPDLGGHLWDDGLGHHGWNLLTGTSNVIDVDGHGTQLAGIIGAVS